jgi:hypothetical protein
VPQTFCLRPARHKPHETLRASRCPIKGNRPQFGGRRTRIRLISPATATVQSGGVVRIEAASNLLSSQALVQTAGTLAVHNDFIPQAQIAPTSSGTVGIDVLGFTTPVDLSVLGNGSMSTGSSMTGSYVANTLGVGTGSTYRLGGGGTSTTRSGRTARWVIGPQPRRRLSRGRVE